jgi:predicted membrane protein
MSDKLSHEEFVKKAVVSLRKEGFKGIHTVYSGFNEAFKKYFDGDDPIKATTQLSQENKIVIRPVKGGVMLYLPEDAPAPKGQADEALKKMGL